MNKGNEGFDPKKDKDMEFLTYEKRTNQDDRNSNSTRASSHSKSTTSIAAGTGSFIFHRNRNQSENSRDTKAIRNDFSELAEYQKKKEALDKELDKSFQNRARRNFVTFYRRFSVLFLSPIFLRHRNWFITILEVFAPVVIVFIIFSSFTGGITWKQASAQDYITKNSPKIAYPELNEDALYKEFKSRFVVAENVRLYVAPYTKLTADIMDKVLTKFNIAKKTFVADGKGDQGVVFVSSAQEVKHRCLLQSKTIDNRLLPVGITFIYDEKDLAYNSKYPKVLSYAISMNYSGIGDTENTNPYIEPPTSKSWKNPYIKSGFSALQFAIDCVYQKMVIDEVNENKAEEMSKGILSFSKFSDYMGLTSYEDLPQMKLKMFHDPNFFDGHVRKLVTNLITCTLVIAYMMNSYFIVRQIVRENKMGIKDMLKMHGMPLYLHWVILLFHTFLLRAITALFMTWALFQDFGHGALCHQSSEIVVFILLWVHMCSLTFFNFFLAVISGHVYLAAPSAIFVGFMSFFVPITLVQIGVMGWFLNFILCAVFPNWALANAIWFLVDYECDDKAVLWINLFEVSHVSTYLTLGQSLLILAFSSAAYFLLAMMSDITNQKNLYPTYRWYNFFQKYRQRKVNRTHHKELLKDMEDNKEEDFPKPAIYQEPPADGQCFVKIRRLCKTFSKHKIALQEISMNIYHEEITVLLGHSGSGKSTVISILAGMVCPTTGYAAIKDFDVSLEAKKSRKFTGLCPQKLIYFNLLTVTEHVTLCYRLRGYDKQETNRHTSTLLIRLKLWAVRKQMPSDLNPDELRRLGMAMALADAPKVLLLDEPTSDMDSMSRREIWGILKDLKKHHTIIMSTNFMDEAEYLGDRIALIAHGKLICYGSSEYLKEQYDTGYFMRLQPYENVENARDLDTVALTEIVKRHLGEEVREKKNVSIEEMHYQIFELPRNQFSNFADVCEELETRKESLGVRKFSIRQVSLSDIFIKICESIVIEKDAPDLYVRRDSTGNWRSAILNQLPVIPEDQQSEPQIHDHIVALFKKRLLYMKTHNDYFFLQYLFPIILIMMVVWQAQMYVSPVQAHPSKNFSLSSFHLVEVYYRIEEDDMRVNYSDRIENFLKGAGTLIGKSEPILTKLYAAADAIAVEANTRQQSVAIELKKDQGTGSLILEGYFSSGALHSPALALNILGNVRLRALSVNHSIYTINAPLPDNINLLSSCGSSCIVFGIIVSLGFAFITAAIVVFPLKERKSRVKHLQLMTGVHPVVYWATDYIYDFMIMLLTTFLLIGVFLMDFSQTFATTKIIGVLFALSFFYLCWSSIPFCYFVSTIMPVNLNGFNFMIGIHLVTGVIPVIWLELISYDVVGTAMAFFRTFFLIFPAYAITSAMKDFFEVVERGNRCRKLPPTLEAVCSVDAKTKYHNWGKDSGKTLEFISQDTHLIKCCKKLCIPDKSCYVPPEVFTLDFETAEHPKLVADLTALIIQGVFFWILLIISERKVIPRLMQFIVLKFLKNMEKQIKPEKLSRDIRNEKVRVNSLVDEDIFPADDVLLVKGLTKSYTSTMVINDFTLEVKMGQCVGILGGGGSGKSTIMQMLTGETIPTRGMCYIGKYNLLQHPKEYLSRIGYCPQKNALFDNFTGVQMLELIGSLKGIPKVHLNLHIRKWLQILGLSDAAKDLCKNYGSGMQRRLCAAMALIGGNRIILLDEPTSGVDPISRQRFWAVMHQLRATGHTIVFTSFNTEECSNLASKLIVISEGNVQCVGSPEELIERFSFGHTLIFRLCQDVLSHLEIVSATMGRVVELKKIIEQTFKYANLVDEQDSILIYFLRNTKLAWSDIFRKCDNIKAKFSQIVESYDVTESLLEDLFILLTNKYREMDNPRRTEPLHPFEVPKAEAELADYKKATKSMHDETGTV